MTCENSSFSIIDSHMHIRGWFHNLPELLDTSVKIREACNLEAVNVASISQWDEESLGQNLVYILFKAMNPGKTYAFGSLDYYLPGSKKDKKEFYEQVKRLMAMGFDGMKMVEGKPTVRKNIGNIPLNSPEYDDYYGFLESAGVPVLFHIADPEINWDPQMCSEETKRSGWFYGDGTFVEKETLYKEVDSVLERFPKLRIYFAHFYFLSADIDRAAAFLDRWPSVSFDVTPGREMYYNFSKMPDRWHDFFTKYQDRILFGTDNGWGNDLPPEQKISNAVNNVKVIRTFLETGDEFTGWGKSIKGIQLDCEALRKIYRENFLRFAGNTPKSVNMDYVKDYCSRLLKLLAGRPDTNNAFMQIRQASKMLEELNK